MTTNYHRSQEVACPIVYLVACLWAHTSGHVASYLCKDYFLLITRFFVISRVGLAGKSTGRTLEKQGIDIAL